MLNDSLFWIVQGFFKYLPFDSTRALRSWLYRPFFRRCGARIRIEDAVTIKYPSQIELGDDTVINQNCFLVGMGGLYIGRDVMIGNNTVIVTTTHVTDDVETPMRLQGIRASRTVLGDDIWVGSGVVILGGAHIGDHSIVAAGATVLPGLYPSYAILGGVPAQLMKLRQAGREPIIDSMIATGDV